MARSLGRTDRLRYLGELRLNSSNRVAAIANQGSLGRPHQSRQSDGKNRSRLRQRPIHRNERQNPFRCCLAGRTARCICMLGSVLVLVHQGTGRRAHCVTTNNHKWHKSRFTAGRRQHNFGRDHDDFDTQCFPQPPPHHWEQTRILHKGKAVSVAYCIQFWAHWRTCQRHPQH